MPIQTILYQLLEIQKFINKILEIFTKYYVEN